MSTVAGLFRFRISPLRHQRYLGLLQPPSIGWGGTPFTASPIVSVIRAVQDLLLRISRPMAESLGVADLHQRQGREKRTGATSLVLGRTYQAVNQAVIVSPRVKSGLVGTQASCTNQSVCSSVLV